MIEELFTIRDSDGNTTFKVTGLSDSEIVQIEAEFWGAFTHTMLDRAEVQLLRDALDRWLTADGSKVPQDAPD